MAREEPDDGGSPPVPRVLLGSLLVALRTECGLDAKEVARQIGLSPSQYSKIEKGTKSIALDRLKMLVDDVLQLDEARSDDVLSLAAATERRAWWDRYGDVLPADLESLVGVEQSADEHDALELAIVPGLLQTEDYARALISVLVPAHGPASLDRAVRLRMTRQEILQDPERRIHFIIDEAALRRAVGGPEVMRAQMRRLLGASELPAVTIQVIPMATGAHEGQEGPFTVFTYRATSSREKWQFAYNGGPFGNLYESEQKSVFVFVDRFARLLQRAPSPEDSHRLIEAIAKEYT